MPWMKIRGIFDSGALVPGMGAKSGKGGGMAGKRGRPSTQERRQRLLLEHLAQGSSLSAACEAAGADAGEAEAWRAADPVFAVAWDRALEAGTDRLEDEAFRRAAIGVVEPVFYQGKECGTVRKYSDSLLMFLLKARRAETYRERGNIELTGKGGGPVVTDERDLANRVAVLLDRARAREESGGNG